MKLFSGLYYLFIINILEGHVFCNVHILFLLQFDMLELDRLEKTLLPCPLLLNAETYLPDTVDLTQDPHARAYWLQCFVDSIDKVRLK
jgi:hypothetical protein